MSIYDDNDMPVSKPKKVLVEKAVTKQIKKPTKAKVKKTKEPKLISDSVVVLNTNSVTAPQVLATPLATPIVQQKREPDYIKHLIECRCHLPQFEHLEPIPNHKFIVFSELDEYDMFKQSYVQCNNCGIIHRVTEFQTSYTIKKETMMSLPTIEDLKTTTPEWLSGILMQYQCEMHVWQEAKFILDNELWGRFVILSKEKDNTIVFGKVLHIIGTKLYKIENFERNDEDARPY